MRQHPTSPIPPRGLGPIALAAALLGCGSPPPQAETGARQARTEAILKVWYEDSDADGYGNPSVSLRRATRPPGYVINNGDCDDTSALRSPANAEVCDALDNDCDAIVDDGLPADTWFPDQDGDGYGNTAQATTTCADLSATHSLTGEDCDDGDAFAYPRDRYIKLGTNLFLADGVDSDGDGVSDYLKAVFSDLALAAQNGFTHVLWLDTAIENAQYRHTGEDLEGFLAAFLGEAHALGLKVIPAVAEAGSPRAILDGDPSLAAAALIRDLPLSRIDCPPSESAEICFAASTSSSAYTPQFSHKYGNTTFSADGSITLDGTDPDTGSGVNTGALDGALAVTAHPASWRFTYYATASDHSAFVLSQAADGYLTHHALAPTCEAADADLFSCHLVFATDPETASLRLYIQIGAGKEGTFDQFKLEREGLVNLVRRDADPFAITDVDGHLYEEGTDFQGQADCPEVNGVRRVCDPRLGLDGLIPTARSDGQEPYLVWLGDSDDAPEQLTADFLQAFNNGMTALETSEASEAAVVTTVRWITDNAGPGKEALDGFHLLTSEVHSGGFDNETPGDFDLGGWVEGLVDALRDSTNGSAVWSGDLFLTGDMFNPYQNGHDHYYRTDGNAAASAIWDHFNGDGQDRLVFLNWLHPSDSYTTAWDDLLADEAFNNEPSLLLGYYDSGWYYTDPTNNQVDDWFTEAAYWTVPVEGVGFASWTTQWQWGGTAATAAADLPNFHAAAAPWDCQAAP